MNYYINDDILVNLDLGEVVHLSTGRTFSIGKNEVELLSYFLTHPGEVLSRQQLIAEVWAARGVIVEDGSLMQAISMCRKALGDKGASLIFTERGKGYRFTGSVSSQKTPTPNPEHNTVPEKGSLNIIDSPKPNKLDAKHLFTFNNFMLFLLALITTSIASYNFGNIRYQVVEELHYTQCKVPSDNNSFRTIKDITIYKLNDLMLLIDSKGESLAFLDSFEGVSCEN